MIFKINGVYKVEFDPKRGDLESQTKYYNDKFGEGNWIFVEKLCTSLHPDCGYGPPLKDCLYKDGRCIRPR
jgi:hypothetical protein